MKFAKKAVALVGAAAMATSMAACGSDSSTTATDTSSSDEKVTLSVWAWESTYTAAIKKFEEKYPNITIKLENVGTNTDEYTALDNAISAGSGAPDVAQIEYYALPQYAIKGNLLNIADKGASDYKDFYTPGTWSSVNYNDGIYGLPMDSGPMAFFYNKAVFDKAGIKEAPATWDEFYEDAKLIRKVDSYITSDSGDAGFYDSMVWQAGGTPFKTTGTDKVSINLTDDAGAKKFTELWQKMIDEDLIDTKTTGWTDEWNRGMNDGSIAGLLTGAWMPANLLSGAPDAAGDWRVAQLPQYSEGETANSENGGSSLAILSSTEKADAAYKFVDFMSHDRSSIDTRVEGGAFPADTETLEDSDFLSKTTLKNADGDEVDYFGGQKYNEVLAKAAENVTSGYQFLPFEIYARGIYGDTAGAAFTGKTTLAKGVESWQSKLKEYATQQGFTVE
ncbi:MAG: sugar ABC transporter substrate-binding protein [Bifidobacteriaceae bacterium]|jgi:multiple sugar transport system substrate-binding protein|nr:sugar ABC transporter substrate-binding protein [Bifidobacteriaceae bacterium]MCI1979529.1 sugar ABC transporter substrate-binding protein [Bifidobacteriaceae bacterium]